MRQLILLFYFLLIGCVNADPFAAIEPLNEVERTSEPELLYTPGPTINYSEALEELPYSIYEPCLCEYTSWKDHGLICVGIRCTDECSEEVRSCNERRRACVPEPLSFRLKLIS